MRTVYQEDTNGCWIACAAMLSGKTYQRIRSRFDFRDEVTGRSATPLTTLLDELGIDVEKKSTKVEEVGALRELKCDALIYFKNLDQKGKEGRGHWMVWDHREKVIRDPEGWSANTRFKIKCFRRVKRKQ